MMWFILSALSLAAIAMAVLPPADPAAWEDLPAEEQASSSRALVIAACLIAAFLGFVISGIHYTIDPSAATGEVAATDR